MSVINLPNTTGTINNLTVNGLLSTGTSVIIGTGATPVTPGNIYVAIGSGAGATFAGTNSVIIGFSASNTNTSTTNGQNSICIGSYAGRVNCGYANVAIGLQSLDNSPNVNRSVAIGMLCMKATATGAYSVAIGYKAGETQILDNSIILNAGTNPLNASTAGLFINPIASRVAGKGVNVLCYDPSSKEIYYSTT